MSTQKFKDCIDACVACAIACSHCASSCLSEKDVKMMVKCIQLDLECAAICRSAEEIMSLGSKYSAHLCRVCVDACAEECEKHAQMGMEHCKICAEACRNCAEQCEKMATAA